MYEILSTFAQTWGLLIFVALFGAALVYALWPRNQARFDAAASAPLTENDTPAMAGETEDETHVRA
ncbi:cbb3-type cytochrome c oxidase subunit 3 [Maricaulis sp.]|uniref:cbb3-type cytochrome c oxidase subunit 3 n=1 Tax=Maricaulis sp. TaxID=1486257 RepID=UPI0025C645B4|nr:cbb3-type cytochrome c oxidase subunit 3 [Maricaulis sp.]